LSTGSFHQLGFRITLVIDGRNLLTNDNHNALGFPMAGTAVLNVATLRHIFHVHFAKYIKNI